MAKKKDNKALFEVLSKSGKQPTLGVPDWMKSHDEAQEQTTPTIEDTSATKPMEEQPVKPTAIDSATVESGEAEAAMKPLPPQSPLFPLEQAAHAKAAAVEPAMPANRSSEQVKPDVSYASAPSPQPKATRQGAVAPPQEAKPTGNRPQQAATRITTKEPQTSTAGRQQQTSKPFTPPGMAPHEPWVSLTKPQAMLTMGIVLIGLVFSFVAGYLAAPTDETPSSGETESQTKQPAKLGSFKGKPERGGVVTTLGQRNPQKWYLLIEVLGNSKEDRDEAKQIKRFLDSKGEKVSLHINKISQNEVYIWIWSLRGFDRPDLADATQFAKLVQNVWGKEYSQKYNKYVKFTQTDRSGKVRIKSFQPGSWEKK